MKYLVKLFNGIALFVTCIQSIYFMGKGSNIEIFNLVMFSFFTV